jgi:plastocyanin
VVASSLLPITYKWFHNGVALSSAGDGATLTLNNAQTAHAGRYHVVITSAAGSTASAPATLDVFVPLPTIVIQPANTSVPLGGNAGLAVGALSPVPLAYQWFFNGSPMTNVSALITLENVQVSQAGDYFVVVSNSAGAVTSAVATVQVVVPLPIITSHPVTVSVLPGSTVTFDVRASSEVPMTYRWFFNGVQVSEPNSSSSLTLTSVQLVNAGEYHVVVGNSAGSVRSASARLQVSGAPPRIVNQPASVDALAGDTITFTVTAASDLPVTYQWYLFDVAIAGATDATLTLTNVHLAQTGNYSAVVSNALGTATSAAATLTVADPAPVITTQPVGASLSLGGNVTLFVAASSPLPLTYAGSSMALRWSWAEMARR